MSRRRPAPSAEAQDYERRIDFMRTKIATLTATLRDMREAHARDVGRLAEALMRQAALVVVATEDARAHRHPADDIPF